MPDRISIEGLNLAAEIGVYAHEVGKKQRLVVDIVVDTDTRKEAASDSIADAIDYDRLAEIARGVASEQHRALVESFAEEVARRVLATFGHRIARVMVRVAKPGAVPDARTVAVEIHREA